MFQSTYDSTGSSGLYDNYNSVTSNGNGGGGGGSGPYSTTNGNGSGPYSSPMGGNDGGYRSSRSSYGTAPNGNGYGDDRDRYRYTHLMFCDRGYLFLMNHITTSATFIQSSS